MLRPAVAQDVAEKKDQEMCMKSVKTCFALSVVLATMMWNQPMQASQAAGNAAVLTALELSANKTAIEIFKFPLNERFSPAGFAYTSTVDPSIRPAFSLPPPLPVTSIKINDGPALSGIPFKVDLKEGDNIFNIAVKSPDGSANTYKLTVTQKDGASGF